MLPVHIVVILNVHLLTFPGLVVAVKDHEHFRLKLVYSRKKKIQNNLRDAEVRVQIYKVCYLSNVNSGM